MEVRDFSPLAAFSHRIGYAGVSSVGQNLDSQLDVLQNAGCGKIFSDKMTGSRMDRPGWDQLLAYVRMGDTLVVTELSRMTRSLLDLLETAKVLSRRKVNLVSLRENIDTKTATGRCFLSMMGAIHQMERELRAERARQGAHLPGHAGKREDGPERMSRNSKMPEFCTRTQAKLPPRRAQLPESDDGYFSRTWLQNGNRSLMRRVSANKSDNCHWVGVRIPS